MYRERLNQLRETMTRANIDYYYVPAADAHRNEYVPECWRRRAWITGFTGSAGDALIGKERAYLWTDGRYFLQAEQQLDPNYFQLMKLKQGTPPMDAWLTMQGSHLRIAVDSKLLTIQQHKLWSNALKHTHSEIVSLNENWIDSLWEEQPPLPSTSVFTLDIRYTGREAYDKIADLRKALKKQGANAIVLTRLDAIAWLFNMRGNDIEYNPLAICYAIVTQKEATLFIEPNKITKEAHTYFQTQRITLADYNTFSDALNAIKTTVLLDPDSTSWWTLGQLKNATPILAASPITLMKAIKNATEQEGMRTAHCIDAVAMAKFLHWIERHWQDGITEISAAEQLETFRREDPRCKDLSFATISGFGSNGAIIHYSPEKHSNKTIDDSALYLVDSGGQYFEGTTDVTRTLHLGEPSDEEKMHYTLVLKGHIALCHTKFPAGTFGEQIDAFARHSLWNAGLDYAHGTGHGVGCYLCVHEGPQGISSRTTRIPLEVGMVVSNEPGVYKKGQHGVRIENVCLVREDNDTAFLTFEDLTLVPYAQKLININLLNSQEIDWINQYHKRIYKQIGPHLSDSVSEWLKEATKPLRSTR